MRYAHTRLWAALVIVVVALALAGWLGGAAMMGGAWPAAMVGPGMMGRYDWPGNSPGVGGWGWGLAMALGWLAMLTLWGAAIAGLVLVVRWLVTSTNRTGERTGDSGLDILNRRLAAGEITQEQYEQMRQVLQT